MERTVQRTVPPQNWRTAGGSGNPALHRRGQGYYLHRRNQGIESIFKTAQTEGKGLEKILQARA